jgi:hypothetical protein
VEFTAQKLSAHPGSAVFWACLQGPDVHQWVLCEARKLTHVAYFRRDPMVLELLGINGVASQSSLSASPLQEAFGAVSDRCGGGVSKGCLRAARAIRSTWTRRGGHQEGVQTGCTRMGFKPCCGLESSYESVVSL